MEPAVVEESQTRRSELAEIQLFVLVEELEVDEVADAIASGLRDGVELCATW